jgi:hypothetical protein
MPARKCISRTSHISPVSKGKLKDRGAKYGNFQAVGNNKQPAVFLELGFLINPTEDLVVGSPTHQAAVQGQFNGLLNYYSNKRFYCRKKAQHDINTKSNRIAIRLLFKSGHSIINGYWKTMLDCRILYILCFLLNLTDNIAYSTGFQLKWLCCF